MTRYRCAVAHCLYIADFVVCGLHEADRAQWQPNGLEVGTGRTIVRSFCPTGDLTEADLIKVEASEGSICAWACEQLTSVPTTPSNQIHPNFDLTREEIS